MDLDRAYFDMVFHLTDEYGDGYQWMVRPNPDAPDAGVEVQYQEFEQESRQWKDKGSALVIGVHGAELLGKALIRLAEEIKAK